MRIRRWLPLLGVVGCLVALVAAGGADRDPQDEKETVKVYPLADLVAPLRLRPGALEPCNLAEWSAGLQSDAEAQLGRIEQVLRLAVPQECWNKEQGGAIAAYPEKLCLVIRTTVGGHRAIENLLQELRKQDDFEIELQVELITFEGVQEEKVAQQFRKLGHPMTADELAELRAAVPSKIQATVRIPNGRTVVGGGLLQSLLPRFTAVATADRSSIDLRLDNITDDARDHKYSWTTQSQTIPAGETVGMLVNCDGGSVVFLVTPRIAQRHRP